MSKTSLVSNGSGERTYTCPACGYTQTESYTLGSDSSDSGSSSDGPGGGGSSW
jgi:hypothetical protein